VLSLKYGTKHNEKACRLKDSVFYEVARTRTILEVLPNLRSLCWDSIQHVRHATLFMHDKVTEFAFKINSKDLPPLCTDIVGRMPSLRSLRWTNNYRESQDLKDDQGLLQLLSSLQKLREVTPPEDFLSSKFLKALSSLPELEVIQYDNSDTGRMPYYSISPLKCTLQEGAFPKLYDLRLHSNLDDIRGYLTGGALFPQLRNLSVESANQERPLTVRQFLTDVTRCYPTLEMVSMDVIVDIEEQELQDKCKPLSPQHLNPILLLKQLTCLELRHNRPLRISEVDLAEFGTALPGLEKLLLNPEPLQLTRPEIKLHSLLIVAQHFPNLVYLGIYLDAQNPTIIPMPDSPANTRLFPRLLTLHFGVSPIASEVPVAMFLSHILSENECVKIESGVSWDRTLFKDSVKYSATVKKRRTKWDCVVNYLPLLFQLHKEEKARRRDIERELEDLRMKNEVIMEKLQMNERAKSTREV
jgi:hypothetical protein